MVDRGISQHRCAVCADCSLARPTPDKRMLRVLSLVVVVSEAKPPMAETAIRALLNGY
jgi:hypothetical protein